MRLLTLLSNGYLQLFVLEDVFSLPFDSLSLYVDQSPWGDVEL